MKVSSNFLAFVIAAALAIPLLVVAHRNLSGGARLAVRYGGVALVIGLFFGAMHYVDAYDRAVEISKAMIAITAAGAVFYEQHRAGMRRPVSERWKRFVGLSLGIAAICTYFNGLNFGFPKYYHRWEHFHYYMGAKYFPEMGYDGLYRCTAIAQDELGVVTAAPGEQPFWFERRLDMKKEVRHPDKKIRNLGGDNLLMPVTEVLEHPETCKAHFSDARWSEFKEDVKFFRMACDKKYWEDMQGDHGYNPPPVWTIGGYFFSSLQPAGKVFDLPIVGKTLYLQVLAMVDVAYLAGIFALFWWAFGWRVAAVGAVLFGTQGWAPIFWTQGAFLRQDWLFFIVLAACAARKKHYYLAGAAMVYAGLLRIFPGLMVIGWLALAGHYLWKHKTLSKPMLKLLAGGTLAAALLIPLSLKVAGKDSYQQFYHHTLEIHDKTPLTNHMGWRVIISQKVPFEIPGVGIGVGQQSGRMKYVKDDKLRDPFEVWMRMRNERYAKLRLVAYGVTALVLAFFVWMTRRMKSLWLAQCLAQIFVIMMSQLTSYYYAFLVLLAPLTKAQRRLEVPIFGLSALSQGIYIVFGWNDDKYWSLTFITLAFCGGMLCAFTSPEDRAKLMFWKKPAPRST
jgi:hypothetical protein